MDDIQERRQCERVLFSVDDKIKGIFTFQDIQKDIFDGNIMNIGEGGLCCSYRKDKTKKVNKHDRLILNEINGSPLLTFMMDIEIEVKWSFENEFFDHIEFGCEFKNMSDHQKDQIRQFVESHELQ